MICSQLVYQNLNYTTELCDIGCKYKTDKSPLTENSHIYTPVYDFLLSPVRYKNITFGEIGIYENASMKMWREYFPNAQLYGWDCKQEENTDERYKINDFVQSAKNDCLENTIYDYMNVTDQSSITKALEKTQKKFDVLIDDSDHNFWSQLRIIRSAVSFLKTGGMLILEDINMKMWYYVDEIEMYGHDKFYTSFTEVRTSNPADQILVLIRNGVEA